MILCLKINFETKALITVKMKLRLKFLEKKLTNIRSKDFHSAPNSGKVFKTFPILRSFLRKLLKISFAMFVTIISNKQVYSFVARNFLLAKEK